MYSFALLILKYSRVNFGSTNYTQARMLVSVHSFLLIRQHPGKHRHGCYLVNVHSLLLIRQHPGKHTANTASADGGVSLPLQNY